MKITHHSGEASFFVSFSDVLFALMCIFVFLMLIVATQVHAPGLPLADAKKQQNEIASQKQRIKELTDAINEKDKSIQSTQKTLADAVATKPIDVVFMIDGSASMEKAMEHLKRDVTFIASQMPNYTTRLRIGIIVYRAQLEMFSLQQIHPVFEDGGASLDRVKTFVDSLSVIGGSVDTALGMREGMKMLSVNRGSNTRCAYVVIGDVGPYEMTNGRGSAEIADEDRLVNELAELSKAANGMSVIMVLEGREPFTDALWQRMALAPGAERGSVEYSSGSMLGKILLSLLDPRKH